MLAFSDACPDSIPSATRFDRTRLRARTKARARRGHFARDDQSESLHRRSARQIHALVTGSIELSAQAPDPLIRAVERGTDLTMLSGLANSAAYGLVADRKFRSL